MKPYYADDTVTLHHGDSLAVLRDLPDASVNCCVTSPPYFGLRDYDHPMQYGLEASADEYAANMVEVFREVRRVLADDGVLWLNIGDSYDRSGQLLGIPWRVAFGLQGDGWTLRNAVVWSKPNGLPEPVSDRMAKRHELVFLLAKSRRYWFDVDPIREQYDGDRAASRRARSGRTNKTTTSATAWSEAHPLGRNPGDVWDISVQPFAGAHCAVMPTTLAERCVLTGCKPGGVVLDPFNGSGTTGLAATRHGRRYVGIDLNPAYLDLSLRTRLTQAALLDEGESA